MNARQFEEALERQNQELEAAMKQLAQMGDVQFAIPDEVLQQIDEACAPRTPQTANIYPGVRA